LVQLRIAAQIRTFLVFPPREIRRHRRLSACSKKPKASAGMTITVLSIARGFMME